MGKIISFANQKGGVGKTTTAINIASSLGVLGMKTLLCDIDPQANATSGVGVNKKKVSLSLYDGLIGKGTANDIIVKTNYSNLSLLPSDINLAGAEVELADADAESRCFHLRNLLSPVVDKFDFIIIDCPPSLGVLTLNSLCASNSVIITTQCEYFALEGLSQLSSTIRRVKKLFNPSLDLEGIIVTMYDGRLNLSVQVLQELKKFFPDKIYNNLVPRTVRLSESPSYGMPIYYYDKSSKGNDCYLSIAKEILNQNSSVLN